VRPQNALATSRILIPPPPESRRHCAGQHRREPDAALIAGMLASLANSSVPARRLEAIFRATAIM
jgi:hypothetical protein